MCHTFSQYCLMVSLNLLQDKNPNHTNCSHLSHCISHQQTVKPLLHLRMIGQQVLERLLRDSGNVFLALIKVVVWLVLPSLHYLPGGLGFSEFSLIQGEKSAMKAKIWMLAAMLQ